MWFVDTSSVVASPYQKIFEHILNPTDQITFNDDSGVITLETVVDDNYLGWTKGEIHFNNIALKEAAKLLERWYGVNITIENRAIEQCRVNGIYKDQTLLNILKSFQFILGIEYRFESGNKIFVNGDNCNAKAIGL